MPHLVRVYIRQVAIGFVISAGFVALILTANVGNLWHLVTHASGGWLAVLMLWIFNGIVFSGVQFALALPSGGEADDDTGHRDPVRVPLAEPVPIRVHRGEAPRRF